MLNSSFDAKLKNLNSRAASCLKELNHAKEAYGRACREFGMLDAEPEVDNPYVDFTGFLKDQKHYYTVTLTRIVNEWDASMPAGPNLYERYSIVLSRTDRFIQESLESNNKFKYVLYTHGRYFDNFKRSFSAIERQRNTLKNELESMSKELLEYNTVNSRINSLSLLGEELNTAKNTISLLKGSLANHDAASIDAEEAKLAEDIEVEEKSLKELNRKISDLREKINHLTAPLGRISKKYDHISARKVRLSDILLDPLHKIKGEDDYKEFKALLTELKKALESGSIESKNGTKEAGEVLELMNADLYGLINSFNSTEAGRQEIEKGIKLSANAMSRIKDGRMSHQKAVSEIESTEAREKEIIRKISETKANIEKAFFDYYKKKITITD